MNVRHVLFVNSLADFQLEVPPPEVVRLNLTQQASSKNFSGGMSIPSTVIHLDLQAINREDQIVWLHYHIQMDSSFDGTIITPRDRSIAKGMPKMRDIVKDWLASLGYEVRNGQFGTPSDVKPIRGEFECVRWEKDGEEYQITPAEVGADAAQ